MNSVTNTPPADLVRTKNAVTATPLYRSLAYLSIIAIIAGTAGYFFNYGLGLAGSNCLGQTFGYVALGGIAAYVLLNIGALCVRKKQKEIDGLKLEKYLFHGMNGCTIDAIFGIIKGRAMKKDIIPCALYIILTLGFIALSASLIYCGGRVNIHFDMLPPTDVQMIDPFIVMEAIGGLLPTWVALTVLVAQHLHGRTRYNKEEFRDLLNKIDGETASENSILRGRIEALKQIDLSTT